MDVTVQNKAEPQLDCWSSYSPYESQQSLKEDYSELLTVCDASEIYLEAYFLWSS